MTEHTDNPQPEAPEPEEDAPGEVSAGGRKWFVSSHGEIYGPADAVTLAHWAAEGRFGCHYWVRETNSPRWVGAESVPELRQILTSWPLPLASLRERVLAQLVDYFIVAIPLLAAGFSAWQSGWGSPRMMWPMLNLLLGGVPMSLALIAANDWILVAFRGQSLGKIVLGIAVVDRRGARPNWATAAARTMTKYGWLLTFLLCWPIGCAGLLLIPVDAMAMRSDQNRQSLHDRWSNTYVCRLRGGPLGIRAQGYSTASSRR